jgi:hypothetical protein
MTFVTLGYFMDMGSLKWTSAFSSFKQSALMLCASFSHIFGAIDFFPLVSVS